MDNRTGWVWTPEWEGRDAEEARLVYFRKRITLAEPPRRAALAAGKPPPWMMTLKRMRRAALPRAVATFEIFTRAKPPWRAVLPLMRS